MIRDILEPLAAVEPRQWLTDREFLVVYYSTRPHAARMRGCQITTGEKRHKYYASGLKIVKFGEGFTGGHHISAAERLCGFEITLQRMKVLDIDNPFTTLTKTGRPDYILDNRDGTDKPRRPSLLECKRIMGFPDDHIVGVGSTGIGQLGNAVVPPVIAEVASQLNLGNSFSFIDLFCGLGGFHLALASLGGKCVFASDFDKAVAERYKENFGMDAYSDITAVPAGDIPPHDIMSGGFPCQDFSIAGAPGNQSPGLGGARSGLFFEMMRIAKHHKPRYIIMENVPPIATHQGGYTIRIIRDTLNDIGYDLTHGILNAAQFGVPQARRRCYFVAWRHGDTPVSLPTLADENTLL